MTLANKEDLRALGERLRAEGHTVVFTNGCFDILHAGHVSYLQKARELGSYLIVGVNSDASVKRLKGEQRPLNQLSDRMAVVEALRCVDCVVAFEEDTPLNVITALRPDILVKGGDYTRDTVVGADVVEEFGGHVVIIPLLEGRSTTSIIGRIIKL